MDIPWWVFIVAWVLLVALSPKKKRPPAAQGGGPPAPLEPGSEALGELGRALAHLQQAENLALKKRGLPAQVSPAETAPARRAAPARRPPPKPTTAKQPRREVFYPKQGRMALSRPSLAGLADDDADKSSEDPSVVSLEGRDYDEEAEKIIAARHRAAERTVREERSLEGMSAAQTARRAGGQEGQAIGGAAEHAEWHGRMSATGVPEAGAAGVPKSGILSRFATGKPRDALILGEILGRPLANR